MVAFEDILKTVRHPGRYLGTEVNAVRKKPGQELTRVALAYPDLYEVAMSYLGLQVLYDRINREEDLWAERVFAPDLDLEQALAAGGLRLSSLESRTPLADFDLIGFTLQHELNYPDVLAMLKMGGIPVRASERGNAHPIVIAGGPGAANPEPLAEAFDLVFLGDAEETIADIARTVGRARRLGRQRKEILDELMAMTGVYVPSRYRVSYWSDGTLEACAPLGGAPGRVRRRLLLDLDRVPPPGRPLIPCVRAIHDRLAIEIQRGCTRGCRFCQAGMINRPVRCRSPAAVLRAASDALPGTGFEQVSLLSLSAGDHPGIIPILERFFERFAPERVSASLPSLRAETLTPALAGLVKTVRKSGFTIAPEAGTARLRRVIHKDLTDQDVLSAALGAFSAGWRSLKLYFMVGLPTETREDLEGIIALVERIRREIRQAGFRSQIHVGLSVFVPKAHTPFQWEAMIDRDRARSARSFVQDGLRRIGGVKVGWSQIEMSWAEGLLARGDRRQFAAIESLSGQGQRLAAWSEHFRLERFEQAFAALGTPGGPLFYLRERGQHEALPWDHLDLGPSREFLWEDRGRAFREEPVADCARGLCTSCGACEPEGAAPVLTSAMPLPVPSPAAAPPNDPIARLRLRFAKQGPAIHLSHLEFMSAVERSLRRARWPLSFSGGFHPKPKMSFGPACPVGVESHAEVVDLSVSGPFDLPDLLGRLRAALPDGVSLVQGGELPPGAPSLMKRARTIRYRLHLGPAADLEQAKSGARELLARQSWTLRRNGQGRSRTLDVRASLESLSVVPGPDGPEAVLEISLRAPASARPLEVAQAAFGIAPPRVIREELILDESKGSEP